MKRKNSRVTHYFDPDRDRMHQEHDELIKRVKLNAIQMLRRALADAGMRQADVARVLGKSGPAISISLSGDHVPSTTMIAQILDACGFEPAWTYQPKGTREKQAAAIRAITGTPASMPVVNSDMQDAYVREVLRAR